MKRGIRRVSFSSTDGFRGSMKTRITVLGAGFGGLELSTLLSESMGDQGHIPGPRSVSRRSRRLSFQTYVPM
jgi:NADH dehydrogenase FAD-containing subunit